MSSPLNRYVWPCMLSAAAVLGCNGDDSLSVPSGTGTLEIVTATSGSEIDPDGYSVQIDGGAAQTVAASGSTQIPDIASGEHTVQLGGMAANCVLEGENPRTVTVQSGETASVTFTVTCGASSGGLQVTASTTGTSPDADGYVLTVDGTERGSLPANGTLAVDGLAAGAHAIGLGGIAANCQVQGDNPQAVTTSAGQAGTISFAVVCTAPAASSGTLQISTATTGGGSDPDGYIIVLDGGAAQPIAVNGSVSLANLAAGPHSVALSGLAGNCDVQGENPRSVSVAAGATATLRFEITCTGTGGGGGSNGSILVAVATTGSPADPDGYTLSLDGSAPVVVGTSASHGFDAVTPGQHRVELGGLAANCAVAEANPRTVTVTAGQAASIAFTVTCGSTAQDLLIAWLQYQPDQGWDILTMRPDGSGVVNLTHAPGDDQMPVWSPDGSKIAYVSSPPFIANGDIVVMNADGSGRTVLTTERIEVAGLAWSPDGSKLAFSKGAGTGDVRGSYQIYTINPDGTGRTLVAIGASPAWSPDGTHIAFQTVTEYGYPLRGSIHVVAADGSGERTLSTPPAGMGDHDPQWSPDGTRLAFLQSSGEDGGGRVVQNLWVVGAEGTNPRKLTDFVESTTDYGSIPGFDWSPDGSTLAYACTVSPWQIDLCLVHPDGTGSQRITDRSGMIAYDPRWSPDGARILFTQRRVSEVDDNLTTADLALLDVADGNIVILTTSPSDDVGGRWRP